MRDWFFLEYLTTRNFLLSILLISILSILTLTFVLFFGIVDIHTLAILIDIIFKVFAVIVGGMWTLNRYYMTRTDAHQINIEDEVEKVEISNLSQSGELTTTSLLIFRLNILNTGSTLINSHQRFLEVYSISMEQEKIVFDSIYRFPKIDKNFAGSIEPKSWSAINDIAVISSSIKIVRLYLEIEFNDGKKWNWHKTYTL